MDPFLETNPVFQELHTQMLAEAQARLQVQIRPKYIARLERHLSEGSVWELGLETLDRKEPDVTIVEGKPAESGVAAAVALAKPTVEQAEELEPDELELRKQRRIVIYVQSKPRQAVTSIELISPSNKQAGSLTRDRYLEKRASALHGGLNWVEIDLLRGGVRPEIPVRVPRDVDYLTYVAKATSRGWKHQVFAWQLRDPLPVLPIPLLGTDQAALDLASCFHEAYDRIAADDEADYEAEPSPPLKEEDFAWTDEILRRAGLRR